MTEIIQVCLLDFNKGQLTGLPKIHVFFVITALKR